MRIIRYSILLGTVTLLMGCAHRSDEYMKKAQVVPPLQMPSGVNLKSEQNYYPLPRKPVVNTPPPSLVPPGSNLERYKESALEPKVITPTINKNNTFALVKWDDTPKGPTLVLAEKPDSAWTRVGKALRATDYQVLDQDATMSSYYILDTKVTKQQITEKTPIYRVYVKKDLNDTSTIVLFSENNNLVQADIAKRILKALQQHLV